MADNVSTPERLLRAFETDTKSYRIDDLRLPEMIFFVRGVLKCPTNSKYRRLSLREPRE